MNTHQHDGAAGKPWYVLPNPLLWIAVIGLHMVINVSLLLTFIDILRANPELPRWTWKVGLMLSSPLSFFTAFSAVKAVNRWRWGGLKSEGHPGGGRE